METEEKPEKGCFCGKPKRVSMLSKDPEICSLFSPCIVALVGIIPFYACAEKEHATHSKRDPHRQYALSSWAIGGNTH